LLIVTGRRHAEDLIEPDILSKVRAFLNPLTAGPHGDNGTDLTVPLLHSNPDITGIKLSGDLPLPERTILDELQARLLAKGETKQCHYDPAAEVISNLEELLAFHGYTRASITVVDSFPLLQLQIDIPNIQEVTIEGNRWVSGRYLRRILKIGGDYYNSYELDNAARRVSSEPAIKTAIPIISERVDGNVDIKARITEQASYHFFLATKFTDIDKYFGVGITWNEFNTTHFQYEGRGLIGILDYKFLNWHRLSKYLLDNHLRFSLAYHDVVKSRDDLDYIFTRQEVRERSGELSIGYRISSSVAVELTTFGKKYFSPVVSGDFPVAEGKTGGTSIKIDLSGKLPFQGPPRLRWRHTFYYQTTGVRRIGNFFFDTFQFNLSSEQNLFRHHLARTTIHGGWITGVPPPQEFLSLGGMHTLPGYPDDEFVDTRMILMGQGLFLSMRSLVNETSVWAPLRLILFFHAGTVWGDEEVFRIDDLRMDAVIEFDYMETIRAGIAIPTGGLRTGSPRVYIGWGKHVY
jgi:hypothetical protein